MVTLVAFASLPFTLRQGQYRVQTASGPMEVHIAENRFNPFLAVTSRPELAQALPHDGQGEGFTSYTWYSHPFVLRVLFGRNVAALGAINSYATISQPVTEKLDLDDTAAMARLYSTFADLALNTLNTLIAAVRRHGKLYHVSDLRRDEIHVTLRDDRGYIVREDLLQADMTQEEQEQDTGVDLAVQDAAWYETLQGTLDQGGTASLAEDLLMEAEMSLSRRFPRQALTTCYSTIETAVSALLTKGMRRRGVPEVEIDQVLSSKNLACKLDSLLVRYSGFTLKRDQRVLWKSFMELNALRNDVVHRGERVTEPDARAALKTTRELLEWLDTVSSRNHQMSG